MKLFTENSWRELNRLFPYAHIETPVHIGSDTKIWQAHVMVEARIGSECTIGDGVHVGPKVRVGNGCKIQNGAQLFEGVTLEDDVFIGPCVTFTNVRYPRAFVSRKDKFEPTRVKRGASIGANAVILCGTTVGEYALVGAGAVVTRDVRDHEIVVGNPARNAGWSCTCGEPIERTETRITCVRCGLNWRSTAIGVEPC